MLFPLALPPGIVKLGTDYQGKNRYTGCNLVRFDEGAIKPHGGWRLKSTSAMTGVGRACIAWADDSAVTRAAIGTETNLYVMGRDGTIVDISPTDLVAGRAMAEAGGGYGAGLYGAGLYGTPREDASLVVDATMWSLDTYGQDLIACNADDGRILLWELDDGTPAAALSGAPTDCRAVVVTPERFIFALGAGGDPRHIAWANREDPTDWTPTDINNAGDDDLQTPGKLMLGKRGRDSTLILTDLDAWIATFIGGNAVYDIKPVSSGCGAISQGCAGAIDSQFVWMGANGFFTCNGGFVQPLPCDVQDYVFTDINRQQLSLVTCTVYPEYKEVLWRYPSSSSTEIDRYVVWNYVDNIWMVGELARLSGIAQGVFQYPLSVGTDGYVYEHEVGSDWGDLVPFLETGPYELGNGDRVATTSELIPDENTIGAITVTFKTRFYPQGDEESHGPYVCAAKNNPRFTGRQMKARYEFGDATDRLGDMRLDLTPGGRR